MNTYPLDIREEELKLRVAKDFFPNYDTANILGSIDFCVAMPKECTLFQDEIESLVWAEAKQGNTHNIYHSFVQLILTIGKARTFDKHLPPRFLAAFDCQRLAFIPYHNIQDVFYLNDFNWNVTPSDHNSKEFQMLFQLVEKTLKQNAFIYNYDTEEKELRKFIKQNIVLGNRKTKRHLVTKNNFTFVYQRWCEQVKQSIQIDWDAVKQVGLLDADFFLADLLSKDGTYLLDNLFVLLKHDHYQFDRNINTYGLFTSTEAAFKDNMQAHIAFWNKYERPPKREYWGYIVERRDLLVPQDVRERKGSFFTPKQWVELSQEYLAKTLGENWQDNYYVWDCCAGTGNLLNGLTNPANIWASTLDKADVDVMHERVQNGANLFDNHIFQFDFLNDPFSKLPQELQNIINNPDKRKRLVIYINPPYAETANKHIFNENRKNKRGVSFTKIQEKYAAQIGIATKELFAQFLIRCKAEISDAVLAQFSTLKIVQGPNFSRFRDHFTADFLNGFVVPANSFDNVSGKFPIGFMIWNLNSDRHIDTINCGVYVKDKDDFRGMKKFSSPKPKTFITDWFRLYHVRTVSDKNIGAIGLYGSDFQHANFIYITRPEDHTNRWTYITQDNLIMASLYLTARHVISPTWLNDRDQFLFPNEGWKEDKQFQFDCLAYTLFHNQNRITAKENMENHWLPFYEQELGITEGFASHFMQDFIHSFLNGKTLAQTCAKDLFSDMDADQSTDALQPMHMSTQANAVFAAGKEIYKYYHAARKQKGGGPLNASLYDIKEYFKGRNEKGNIKATSDDAQFNRLMETLRTTMQALAQNITPKIYQYGFLK